MAFIFSTSTYLVGYNLGEEFNFHLQSIVKSKGLRYHAVDTEEDLAKALGKICYLAGILHTGDLDEFKDQSSQLNHAFYSLTPSQNTKASLEGLTLEILTKLSSPDLTEIMSLSASEIALSFFPGAEMTFKDIGQRTTQEDNFDAQFAVRCETESSPYKGRCELFVNTDKFNAAHPDTLSSDIEKVKDALREYTNQFIGLVNRSFEASDISTKIGIPSAYTMEDFAAFPKGTLYIPYLGISDSQGIFQIYMGYVHPEKGPAIDLTNIEYHSGDDEIDFF